MKSKLTRDAKRNPNKLKPGESVDAPAGTIIEGPDAYLLVEIGMAIPADDECREKCGLSEEEVQQRQDSYDATYHRIHPDHLQAFRAGKMKGYNPDGTWVPGPNYSEADEFGVEEDDDDYEEENE